MLSLALTLLLVSAASAKDLAVDPYLFHSGSRRNLEEDIGANTVPKRAWDEFIFGKTNFDLPEYRKGLYGAEALAGTGLYTLYETLGGGEPWVMVIKVKASCLTGGALFSEGYEVSKDPSKGGRFSRWYHAHREKYRDLEKDCLPDFGDATAWEEGAPYDVGKAEPETQRLTKLCTPVLNDFLTENSVKVALDVVNEDSWYIRDRDCIEEIRGSPDELFDRILDGKVGDPGDDFVRNFYGDAQEPGTFFAGDTFLFLGVAAETTHLTREYLPRLAGLEKTLGDWIGKEKRDASSLRLERNGDHPFLLRLAVRALGRAVVHGRAKELQGSLRDWLISARARLGAACDGKHGVSKEKRAACSAVSDDLSKKLTGILRAR